MMFDFLTPMVQNLLALALVAFAATWLGARSMRRKKSGACGCAGCPSQQGAKPASAEVVPLADLLDSPILKN